MTRFERLAFHLYGVLMRLLCPWVRHRLTARLAIQPLLASQLEERFGVYDARLFVQGAQAAWIWVHAVSLGETRAAGLLMAELRRQHPALRFLLTHGTATGREAGSRLLGPGDLQVWQPWDAAPAVQRFLDHFKPQLALMIETEVWPHWVQGCLARGIPMCLVNARLSEKSFRSAKRLAWLAKPAYQGLTAVWAQTADDALRLGALGAKVQGALGNVKFDAKPNAAQSFVGHQARRARSNVSILLASSRPGEEDMFLQAILAMPNDLRETASFLCVPRHPERFERIAMQFEACGGELVRRSSFATLQAFAHALDLTLQTPVRDSSPDPLRPVQRRPRMFLGDSMGEMSFYYALANVALMGATFEPLGGQNLIEALANGCPVVLGPSTYNFQDAAAMALSAGVARSSETLAQGLQLALKWAHAQTDWVQATERCSDFIREHQGASQSLAMALEPYLPKA
jgi:3-deoxy-D-manno-octulosonic-acid transferase